MANNGGDVQVTLSVNPQITTDIQNVINGKTYEINLKPVGEFAKQLEASLQAAQENASKKAANSVAKNLTSAQEKAAKAWETQQRSQVTAWAKEQIKAEESVQRAKEKADKAWAAQQAKQVQELAKAQTKQVQELAKEQAKAVSDAQKKALQETNSKKLSNDMSNWLQSNTQYAEKYGDAVADLQRRLEEAAKAGDSAAYKQISAEWRELQSEAKSTAVSVTDLGQSLKQALGGTALGALAKSGVALAVRELRMAAREMVSSAVEIESSLAQLQVITGASGSQLETFFSEGATAAKEYGTEVADMLDSVTTFSRLGLIA